MSPIPGGTNAAKIALRHKHKYVVENLPADDVALEMFTGSKGLLTEKEHDTYRSMRDTNKPNFARAEFLLECLKRRGPDSFKRFLGILQKFPASQHIATELRKEYIGMQVNSTLAIHDISNSMLHSSKCFCLFTQRLVLGWSSVDTDAVPRKEER